METHERVSDEIRQVHEIAAARCAVGKQVPQSEGQPAVAAEPIESLDGAEHAPEDIEAAWGEEIHQRLEAVDAGAVAPIPWPEARHRIAAAARGHR